jgi:hypothetical protein
MSRCLDQFASSIDVFQDTSEERDNEDESKFWKNTLYTTLCIPEIGHTDVASSITKTQEERDEMALCCPGGETMRSKILFQVAESIAGIRAAEKEIDASVQPPHQIERRVTKKKKRSFLKSHA